MRRRGPPPDQFLGRSVHPGGQDANHVFVVESVAGGGDDPWLCSVCGKSTGLLLQGIVRRLEVTRP
jgi:hypothetical protein